MQELQQWLSLFKANLSCHLINESCAFLDWEDNKRTWWTDSPEFATSEGAD